MAILAGFAYNRRVIVQGYHGTGKSTHIEQVAARLNWPCIRVNLDSHISRIDLVGKDAIVHQGRHAGHRIPRRHPALGAAASDRAGVRRIRCRPARCDVRDPARARSRGQADAARPEPRDPARIPGSACSPPPTPSAWATPPASITARSRSTRARWTAGTSSPCSTICQHDAECGIVVAKVPSFDDDKGRAMVANMVRVADLTRQGFINGDISTVMCPRTVITWAENAHIFKRRRLCLPPHLPQQVRRDRASSGGRVLPALLRPGTARDAGARRSRLNAMDRNGSPKVRRPRTPAWARHEELPTELIKRATLRPCCARSAASPTSRSASPPATPPCAALRRACRCRRARDAGRGSGQPARRVRRGRAAGCATTTTRSINVACPMGKRRRTSTTPSPRRGSRRSARG